eukprot:scaffold36321_cov63-Attheya_sp.AAC.8
MLGDDGIAYIGHANRSALSAGGERVLLHPLLGHGAVPEETVELVRQFPYVKDPTKAKALEISARLLRRKPHVSIFVSRITRPKKDKMDRRVYHGFRLHSHS